MNSATSRFSPPDIRAIVVVLGCVAAVSAPAVSAQSTLYEAEVAWTGQGAADRVGAFRRALGQVLVKVTGLRRLAGAQQLEPLVENAQGLVQQYQLRTATVLSGDAALQEPRLWVRFDEAAVDRLVREAGLPAWGRTRRSTLVWVALESGGAPRLVGSGDTEGIAEIFRQGAASRGVPLMLPLLDLEDRAQIGLLDLQVEAEERIRTASERYQPGSILLGRIGQPNDRLWEAQWSLLLPGAAQRWKTEGDVLDLVIDQGVQEVADILSAHYTSAASETVRTTIVVSVSGVHDFTGYARTMQYLQSLEEVESVNVLTVFPGRLRLGLKLLRTSVAGLRETVAIGSTLAEDLDNASGALALRLLP